jgi:hypothetical protein
MSNPGMGDGSHSQLMAAEDVHRPVPVHPSNGSRASYTRMALTRPEAWIRASASGPGDSSMRTGSTHVTFGVLACLVSLGLGLLALRVTPEDKIGPYGLIQALSPWYYIAIGILVISFVRILRIERFRSLFLSVHVSILVILLHGAPGVVESVPRFPMAWVTTDFTDYIANTGKILPDFDARFSWPAFFAASAMLDRAAGLSTALTFVRWWPVALNLLYLPFVFRISREFLRSESQAWIATAIFPLANWIGEDYYSPQSVSYLLYLAFFFILIGPLGANERPVWLGSYNMRLRRNAAAMTSPSSSGDLSPRREDRHTRSAAGFYMTLLVLLMAAMATGHQLTPIVATGTALALIVAGRTRIRWMVGAFGLMTLAWVCYGAVAFWSGHRSMLIGGVGSLQGNVSTSVAAKVHGSFPHEFVVDARLGTSLIVWLLAVLGAFVWRPQGRHRAAVILCFIASFGILAGGNYGGEGMLRAYLFGLPVTVSLISALISKLRWNYRQLAVGAVLLLLVPLFLISRWGNELFEMIRPNEVAAADSLFQIARPGSSLVTVIQVSLTNDPMSISTEFPVVKGFKSITLNLTELKPTVMTEITNAVSANPKGGYIVISTSQIDYAWLNYGWPRGWGLTLERQLSESRHFRLKYSNPDVDIFEYVR